MNPGHFISPLSTFIPLSWTFILPSKRLMTFLQLKGETRHQRVQNFKELGVALVTDKSIGPKLSAFHFSNSKQPNISKNYNDAQKYIDLLAIKWSLWRKGIKENFSSSRAMPPPLSVIIFIM